MLCWVSEAQENFLTVLSTCSAFLQPRIDLVIWCGFITEDTPPVDVSQPNH